MAGINRSHLESARKLEQQNDVIKYTLTRIKAMPKLHLKYNCSDNIISITEQEGTEGPGSLT